MTEAGSAASAHPPPGAHSAGPSPAIHTVALAKRYGSHPALAGLTMTVPRGEVFGFLGPNGAGKTTAVKLLLGLARPTGGEGLVLGAPVGDVGVRARIGYLPELFRYQGWMRAREVLGLHLRLAQVPRSSWAQATVDALTTVGLAARGDDRVQTFSKGMQQRLGLAVALLGRPELVVLDEPTSALDPVGRHDVRQVIRQLAARGTTVFLNSHLLTEVEQVCDRVAVVDRGRVVGEGSLASLLGGGAVRVRCTGVEPPALERLRAFGRATASDGWLVWQGLGAERVPELVRELVAEGARIYQVEASSTSLEERFLQLLSPP
ncbi:MAG TPA: ABC transporter ATP-binding protein [Candidatus Micrarchaeia archaeon]|nr:ABC transporter ATP-binding protein [Candidatus Micrarchaeia archaeon]